MRTMVIAKKWGNSMGVILPAEFVRENNIQEGEELDLTLEKKGNVLKELFGALKSKKTSEQVRKEFRKEFESKWME
jgi:antitoxin component of MazEF toxin-antitoxin module